MKEGGAYMLFELVRKLKAIDDSMSIAINLSKDNVWTLSVDGMEVGEYLYSYSSTDLLEAINKIDNFIDCLTDNSKFEKLLSSILNEPLEVIGNGD